MGQRQLNIRSDGAVGLGYELAGRPRSTTTDVGVQALRALTMQTRPRDERGLTPGQHGRRDAIRAAVRDFGPHIPTGTTSDHAWLDVGDGLPK